MPKFRKKPVIVEAIQYNRLNGSELRRWTGDRVVETPSLWADREGSIGLYVHVETPEGIRICLPGDWIVKVGDGEFHPCKSGIFEETYEAVDG